MDNGQSEKGTTVMNVRLHLKARSLPNSIIHNGMFARVRWGTPTADENETEVSALIGDLRPETFYLVHCIQQTRLVTLTRVLIISSSFAQIVHHGSNPKWATTFVSRYDHGNQLQFYVEVFVETATVGSRGIVRGTKSLGRTAFDVRQILGSTSKVVVRKLRDGGL
jgi:hypothetical protein